jgi:hypothetical protein
MMIEPSGRSLRDNKPIHDFPGSTRERDAAAARQEQKRAFERSIADAHKAPGGGTQITSDMPGTVRQDGRIGPSGG